MVMSKIEYTSNEWRAKNPRADIAAALSESSTANAVRCVLSLSLSEMVVAVMLEYSIERRGVMARRVSWRP